MRMHKPGPARLFPGAALAVLSLLVLAVPVVARKSDKGDTKAVRTDLAEEIRHQLVMLPYYSVFDNLEFKIDDQGGVVLSGEVTRPTLKSDAEYVVRKVAGADKVVDKIEVLPLSNEDDRIRIAEYRAIFRNDQLDRYILQAIPPLHIIVKNGNVTLIGVVAREADKDVAGIVANTVPGVFSVTNKLLVEAKGASH